MVIKSILQNAIDQIKKAEAECESLRQTIHDLDRENKTLSIKLTEKEEEIISHKEYIETITSKISLANQAIHDLNELSCVKKELDNDRIRKIILGEDLIGYWKDLEVASYISGSISDDAAL